MEISVEYVPAEAAARLSFSSDFGAAARVAVTNLCRQADPELRINGDSVELAWGLGLPALLEIGRLRESYGFRMAAVGEAGERLQRFQHERRALSGATGAGTQPAIDDRELEQRLRDRNWDFDRRELKDHQLRGVLLLANLPNGANFSVPGAGKTTMTLAIHLAAVPPGTHLFVVAPKNALQAWDDVIRDCLVPGSPDAEPFTRLSGDAERIRSLLASGGTRFTINYDLLIKRHRAFMDYLANNRVHLVLDESHRIKDETSARARALSQGAHLPIRRDILSGTPVPHSVNDLRPQLDFLWPGSGLSRRINLGEPPKQVLSGLYTRTTKDQLDLPPVDRRFDPVTMGQAQYALYGAIRDRTIQELVSLNPSDAAALQRAKRSVMRLLQASTNPVAAAQGIAAASEVLERDRIALLLGAVVREGDSPKILRAVEIVRANAERGRKTVVWTNFRHTIDRVTELMRDLGAVDIHGGVPSGDEDDIDVREGRIKAFHDDPNIWVLVANPAACSEGISLHHACHDAVYLDRTYNAAHYLQSLDRIHRLGLAPGTETNVTVLQSVTPQGVASIDYAVARSLLNKIRTMEEILDDEDLRRIALDEQENVENEVFDEDRDLQDMRDLLEELLRAGPASSYDEEEMA